MRATSRHNTLTNKDCDPSKGQIEVNSTVHFAMYQGAFPKAKLQEWLSVLPVGAKIKVDGIASGNFYLTATFKTTIDTLSSKEQGGCK